MKIESLKGIKRIILNDYSDYDSDKCNNGGSYGFSVEYDRESDETFLLSYGTTSDLDFCPVCGQFQNHYNHSENTYECGDFETVTESEVLKVINNFEESEGCYIEIVRD